MIISLIKKHIIPILKQEGVTKAALFGSFATGTAKKNSDVDLLVELKDSATLFDLSRLKLKLEKDIKKKFDVVTYESINPRLKKIILGEQKIIYEKRS